MQAMRKQNKKFLPTIYHVVDVEKCFAVYYSNIKVI